MRAASHPLRRVLAGGLVLACTAVGLQTLTLSPAGASTHAPIIGRPSGAAHVLAHVLAPVSAGIQVDISADVTDVDGDHKTDLGDTIRWSIAVKNTGNVQVGSLAPSSGRSQHFTCAATTLAVGAATTCTTNWPYAVSQQDVDNGAITDTAVATARTPAGQTVRSAASAMSTTIARRWSLDLTGAAHVRDRDGDGRTGLGDQITWTYLVTNSGTATVDRVQVRTSQAGTIRCAARLAPGSSATCTTSPRTISRADVAAGLVGNTATAAGRNDPSGPVTSAPSTVSTPVVQTSALSVRQSATVTDLNSNGVSDLGDTITWSFAVTNIGTTTLTDVAVSDPQVGPVVCEQSTLTGGETLQCSTAPRMITQADVDAGVITSTAHATGTSPDDVAVTSRGSTTHTQIQHRSALLLTGSAVQSDVDGDFRIDLGDLVTWTFRVTNSGTTTLAGITVTDPVAGSVSCPAGSLAPAESITCTAARAITQADVDAGVVADTATAHGTDPGAVDIGSNTASSVVPVVQSPGLTLAMSATVVDADGDGATDLGDSITWSYALRNTGTTTLTDPRVIDTADSGVTCPTTPLAPGASISCVSSAHTVTQADVDAGVVGNSGTAQATTPGTAGGTEVSSGVAAVNTPIVQLSALSLSTSARVSDLDHDGATDLGDQIVWSFVLQNSGTTTLHDLTVSDPALGDVSCPAAPLAPGESGTCSATRTISQADVDAGVVTISASASASNPAGSQVLSASSSANVAVAHPAALQLTASFAVDDVDGDGRTDLGDQIVWSYLVRNVGAASLSAIAVVDRASGPVPCLDTSLAPGESTTCTPPARQITQADVDAGVVNTTATASGTDFVGAAVSAGPSSSDAVVAQVSSLSLITSALVSDLNGDFRIDQGDSLAWTFLVQNAGTTTLTGIGVDDVVAGAVSCPQPTLAPGARETCTAAPHTISDADAAAGVVSNTAVANGLDPQARAVESSESSTSTPVSSRRA